MRRVLLVLVGLFMGGCVQNAAISDEQMTVAKVQQEIKVGMYSSDVVGVLGTPNMITTDSKKRETWVYDKVSTNVSNSQAGVWLLVGGRGGFREEQSQRTLTIIIKLDENSRVRDFAYRTSSF